MLLINWMSRYTQNTNPYNNIKTLYHGEPKWLTDNYRAIFGTNRWDDCNYRPSGHEDYCDTNECALRHTCEIYKTAYPEPVTPEQAEQMTLQWATRMGGVGANAGANVPPVVSVDVTEQALIDQEMDEERRINAEMDADEVWEQRQRDIIENPEPTNLEEE